MNEVSSEAEVAALLDCAPCTAQEKARLAKMSAAKFKRSLRAGSVMFASWSATP